MQPISVMKINRFNLSFPKTLEKRYRVHHFKESLKIFRIAFICVGILYGLFGFLDAAFIPDFKNFFLLIRFGIVIPVLVIVLALSFLNIFQKIWQWLLFASLIIGATGIIAMILKAPENLTYYPGLMLIFAAGFFFIKLRFFLASIASWIILLLFNISMIGFTGVPAKILIAFNFFYISTILISKVAAYYIELFDRKNFFLTYQLDRKKAELEQSNRSLEFEVKKRTQELIRSEERFRTIFDYSGTGIIVLNPEGHVLNVNNAFCKFLGKNKEEILGNSIPLITHPEDFSYLKALFHELVSGKRTQYELDKRFIHKHSQIVWGRLTVSAVTLHADESPIFIALVADITGHKNTQEALHQERIYYEHLFESAPVGIVLLNNDDLILDCNSEFSRLFQFTKTEVIGMALNDLIVPENLKDQASGLSGRIAIGREIYTETHRKRKDGTIVEVAITGKPVFVNEGQVAIYGIYQDISERKETERDLQKRMTFQENAVKVSARFASTLEMDSAINESLNEISMLSNADRSYLFLIRDDAPVFDNTHEWCAPGIEPQIETLQNLPATLLPWWMEKLTNAETIIIDDVETMPPEAEAERQILKEQDIKSVLVLPVNVGGKLAGFIGFDFVREYKQWSDSDLAILSITSEVIGHALERSRFRQALIQERDLLQSLMDNIPDTIYFKDLKSRFTRINKAQASVIGVNSTDEAIGKTDLDFFNHEHAQIAFAEEQRMFDTGTPIIGNLEYFNSNGKWRWMSATKVPISDQNNKIIGLVGVSHDMTEQKRIEEKLRSRESFLSHLSEITNLSLKALNTHDLFNLLAAEVHKLLSSDISFLTLWDSRQNKAFPVAGYGLTDDRLFSFRAGPHEQTMTESVLKAEKVLVAEDVFNSPYISPDVARQFPSKSLLGLPLIAYGQKLGAVLIGFSQPHRFTDEEIELGTLAAHQIALVVARTRMLEQLVANEKELLKLNAEKDKLFSVIAHDLRSPFTSFLGLTDIMTDETSELTVDEMREFAQAIQKSANGLYQLLENLLEWSRVQGGSGEFNPQKIDLAEIININLGMMKAAAERKNIEIINHIPQGTTLYGDYKMMRSLTGNLISNAIKYTSRGGRVELRVSVNRDNRTQLEVSDTGIGMSEDTIAKLFRIDTKMASQGTEGEPSSGLGLILCREFVEKHGGRIWVESTPGKGSKFFVTMPADEKA